MKGRVSPGTQRRYPLTMIWAIYHVPRSSVYAVSVPAAPAPPPAKPEPKTRHSDAEDVEAIRTVLAACPFHGEGYRKVRARLAHRGPHVGGKRVLRLLRLPRPARATAPRAAEWRSRARGEHHHEPARRDMGHGDDATSASWSATGCRSGSCGR